QYVSYLTELGWPAILLVLWWAVTAFQVGIRSARYAKTPFARWLIPCMIGALASLLLHNIFTPLGGTPNATYFWFIFGAACSYPYVRKDDPDVVEEHAAVVPTLRARNVLPAQEEAPAEHPALPAPGVA